MGPSELSDLLGQPGQVADTYVAGLAHLDPQAAHALGVQPDSLWADLGPQGIGAIHELDRTTLAALTGTASAGESSRARVLRRALQERLTSEIALFESGFTPGLVAPLAAPPHMVLMSLEAVAVDATQVREGLSRIPEAFTAYTHRLDEAAAGGYAVPARQSPTLAAQLRRWADPTADNRIGALVNAHPDLANDPVVDAGKAACLQLADWLEQVHAPRGRPTDAAGEDLYRVTSTAFLGTEVDLASTYDYGWERLRELTYVGRSLARSLGHDDISEAEASLDADPRRHVTVGPELVAWIERRMARARTVLDGQVVTIPPRSPVEAVLAAPGSGSIYYSPPHPGGGGVGRVVWSPPVGTSSLAVWREVSTVHHEGLPGHHLQYSVTMAQEGLHPWQRYLCHVHGYAEGWAHYTEGRAQGWGLVDEPAELLGVTLAQRWRAARIVIDMGLHLGLPIPQDNGFTEARRWTPEVGVEVLTQAAGCDRGTAEFEVVRYLGWPGQALAFSTGARLWEEARAASASSLDELSFHEAALALGPMGMAPLRESLAELTAD